MSIRKNIIKIYLLIFFIGSAYYLWLRLSGIYIPCLVYATTGFKCCGCGVTNMFTALARLDIAAAYSYNPVMFVLFFFWNIIALMLFWGKPAFMRKPAFLYTALGVTVAVLAIYWILRNL